MKLIFRTVYSASHQENFKIAVGEERYKEAKDVLERMPPPGTTEEKISYLLVQVDGYKFLSCELINKLSNEEKAEQSDLDKLLSLV